MYEVRCAECEKKLSVINLPLDESGEMLPVSGCATTTSVTTGGVTTTVYMRQPISGIYNFY